MNESEISTSDSVWSDWIRRLTNYKKKYGDMLVNASYVTGDGYKLGNWVSYQISNKKKLNVERINQLNNLDGWVWNANDAKWEANFFLLLNFSNEQGHCNLPYEWTIHDRFIKLRSWVTKQRTGKSKLSEIRIKKLESIKGWTWHER